MYAFSDSQQGFKAARFWEELFDLGRSHGGSIAEMEVL